METRKYRQNAFLPVTQTLQKRHRNREKNAGKTEQQTSRKGQIDTDINIKAIDRNRTKQIQIQKQEQIKVQI